MVVVVVPSPVVVVPVPTVVVAPGAAGAAGAGAAGAAGGGAAVLVNKCWSHLLNYFLSLRNLWPFAASYQCPYFLFTF